MWKEHGVKNRLVVIIIIILFVDGIETGALVFC